jgi:hypothetical protein
MIAGELSGEDTLTEEITRVVPKHVMEDRQSHTSSITLEDALTYG